MSATVIVRTIPGRKLACEVDDGRHQWVADEPPAEGEDIGPNPYDMLLASLGSCVAMTLVMYARRKDWPLAGVTVRSRHARHEEPLADGMGTRRWQEIVRDIDLDGDLDDAQRARLLEIAGRCPVTRTLQGELVIVDVLAADPTSG